MAVVVALGSWWLNRLAREPGSIAEAPVSQPAPAATTAEPTAKAEGEPAAKPELDVVRVTPEGQAVIAGRAAPDQRVEILVDGKVVGSAETDAGGDFAAVLEVAPSGEARELVLRTATDQTAVGRIALAPAVRQGTQAEPAAPAADRAAEAARLAAEKAEAERAAAQEVEAAQAAVTEAETKRQAAAEAEAKRQAAAQAEASRLAAETAEAERLAAEKAEAARQGAGTAEAGQLAAEQAEAERRAAELAEAERQAAEKAEAERQAAAKAAAEQLAAARADAERLAAAKAEAARLAAAGAEPQVPQFAVSSPVIILPQTDAERAPALVKPGAEDVQLLQPAAAVPAGGFVLDRLTYSEHGDLIAAGRGAARTLIRIYANGELKAEVRAGDDRRWTARLPAEVASSALLLRFDEIGADGTVVSRLETPFDYSPAASVHELHQRKIVVQRGDYLWKFAEQYYGQGWRYSVIFSANADLIRDPDLIYPGQVFTVPELVPAR